MSKIQIAIDGAAGIVGAAIGFMFGEVNGLFWALIAFMALDYISGVLAAAGGKKLSSKVGARRRTCRNVGGDALLYSQ